MSKIASLVVISGAVGVGKTSTGMAASDLLDAAGIVHALIDTDSLNRLYPRDPADRFAEDLMLANLRAISPNFVAAGAQHFILTGVVETPEHLRTYQQATGAAEVHLVRLRASIPAIEARLHGRETGESLVWHLNRAAELSAQMDANPFEDLVIDTDNRSLDDIAREILQRCGWLPAEPATLSPDCV